MKTPAIIFSLFFLSINLNAQLTFYNKEIKIGPTIDIHRSNINIGSRLFTNQRIRDEVKEVKGKNSWGFSAGAIYLMELDDHFALRGHTIISYQRNEIYFDMIGQEDHTEITQPVILSFPLHFVYSGNRNKKLVPSILLGANYMRDISIYKNQKLSLERHDLGIEVGAGFFNEF